MIKKIFVGSVIALMATTFAQAQQLPNNKGFYLGAGVEQLDLDADESPDNYLLQLGYNFGNGFSAEFQYSDSYKTVDESGSDSFYVPELDDYIDLDYKTELSVATTAAYAVYRTQGDGLFAKFKAGFMQAKATADATASTVYGGEAIKESTSESESESGYALGLGAGYKFAKTFVELEYTTTDDDLGIDFISLSLSYQF